MKYLILTLIISINHFLTYILNLLYYYTIYRFNKLTELLFVRLRLFDDWKEEFRSWTNKSRSLAIDTGFAAMSNPVKKRKNISIIEKIFINKNKLLNKSIIKYFYYYFSK